MACGCSNGKTETPPKAADTAAAVPANETVDIGDQRVRSANVRNAGFRASSPSNATVTEPCFGTRMPEMLDMLPSPSRASARDSVLIRQLNSGEVFLLQPGEKGSIETDGGNKLLIRFQAAELWVWKSQVATK